MFLKVFMFRHILLVIHNIAMSVQYFQQNAEMEGSGCHGAVLHFYNALIMLLKAIIKVSS